MEVLTFLAGMQALAAFLQVWQTERAAESARTAYFEAKQTAMESRQLQHRAEMISANIRNNPVLDRLLRNRFGRCEDAFEDALRRADEEELDSAAQTLVRCKCLIMQVIRTAQGGQDPELQNEWEDQNCEFVLGGVVA